MFTKKAFSKILMFWLAIFLSTGISIVFAVINIGSVPFPGILKDIIIGAIIAYFAGSFVPISDYADKFAKLFKAEQGKLSYTLLTTIIYGLYFSIVMGFAFTVIGVGLPEYFVRAFLGGIPLGFVVGSIMALLVMPLCIKLTHMMTNKPVKDDKQEVI